MTKQEAIRNLKAECIGCCHPQAMEYCEHNCEYGIAIECVEKQIPKPKHKYQGIRCVCGTEVAKYQKYCDECGQRLMDWSDNE